MTPTVTTEESLARYTQTALELVNSVLGDIGHQDVVDFTKPQAGRVLEHLNRAQRVLHAKAGARFNLGNWQEDLEIDKVGYELPMELIRFATEPRTAERELKFVPAERWDEENPAGPDDGQPTEYTVIGREILLRPYPNTIYLSDKLVLVGGFSYVCKMEHTAEASNKPGSGADWEDYWDPSGSAAADTEWETGKTYYDGYLRARMLRGLRRMILVDDLPTLPNHFYDAMIARAVWKMKAVLEFDMNDIMEARAEYLEMEHDVLWDRNPSSDNPKSRDSYPL